MANAIEDALNRASAEQRERAIAAIEEARRNIRLVSVRDDITLGEANAVSKQAEAIEEARRVIPFETIQDVNNIDPPMNTPAQPRGHYNSTVVEINQSTQSNIEHIEQTGGNNYLRENAVDRAQARPPQDMQQEQQQQALGR